MTYFHGTTKKFDKFDNSFLGQTTGVATTILGHCFAKNRNDAEAYGDVIECELNIYATAFLSINDFVAFECGEKSDEDAFAFRQDLIEQGYDSIEIEGGEVIIVLDEETIEII